MKTIAYQLFIYYFLITIYGTISNPADQAVGVAEPLVTVKKIQTNVCNFKNLFYTLNGTKDCLQMEPSFNNDLLLKLDSFYNTFVNLCKGILNSVDKICQLDPNLVEKSINNIPNKTSDLINEIQKVTKSKNVQQFCFGMHPLILNISYGPIIDKAESFNTTVEVYNLHQKCIKMCASPKDDSVNPLCSILFWIDKLLLDIEGREKMLKIQEIPTIDAPKQLPIQPNPRKDETIDTNVVSGAKPPPNPAKNGEPEAILGTVKQTQAAAPPLTEQKIAGKKESEISDAAKASSAVVSTAANEENEKKKKEKAKDNETVNSGDAIDKKDKANGADENSVKDERRKEIVVEEGKEGEADADANKMVSKDPKAKETELKTKNKVEEIIPSEDKNGDKENDENLEELQYERGEGIDIDQLEPDERLVDNNDQNIVARTGPPEPPQHFFVYFMVVSVTCLMCYVGYHKKQMIMAIFFEGRKSRGGRNRRRPNTASYRKLDCTLEEAVTSQCNSNVTHVIY